MKLRTITALTLGLLAGQVYAANPQNTTAPAATVINPAAVTAPAPATVKLPFSTDNENAGYALGLDLGDNFKMQSVDINIDSFVQGLKDGMAGNPPKMTKDERRIVMMNFQKHMHDKLEAAFKADSEKNKKEGDAFLAVNKAKPGVVTMADGLQYKVITAGSGAKPTDSDKVLVKYTGTYLNGKVFDDTATSNNGNPITVAVSEVIPGWREALKLMPVGSTWEVVMPPSLAYGERGVAAPVNPIGPNSTLVFKITLVSIAKPATAAPATVANKK